MPSSQRRGSILRDASIYNDENGLPYLTVGESKSLLWYSCIQIHCGDRRAGNPTAVLRENDMISVSGVTVSGPSFSGDFGKATMVNGVNVIAGFRDQPVDDEAAQHKHSKNTSNDKLNHCFVLGTMN